MALDGIFLSKLKREIESLALGTRIDRINQPGRDEIVLNLRGKQRNPKLLICARADSPRLHFVETVPENPPSPPMFCMLLRKHLSGAMLTGVRQLSTDRVIFLDFLATNEIGDKCTVTLCLEIMGKCSNLILIDENGKVIDSIKRVDLSTSSVRQVLPGLEYKLPPQQNKLSLYESDTQLICDRILENKNSYLSSSTISVIEGISPVVSREIAHRVTGYDDYVGSLTEEQKKALFNAVEYTKQQALTDKCYILTDENKKPKDIAFLDINQYGSTYSKTEFDSPSLLLESFYRERDRINRVNHRGKELLKFVQNLIERTAKKITVQTQELKDCENKDTYKLYGELITSNLYKLNKGSTVYEVENYYDNMSILSIPVNPALTPTDNANKYYKDYRKAKTAEVMLEKLIAEAENELAYFETVHDEILRAETDAEILNIRVELIAGGYVKDRFSKKKKPPKELPPLKFETDDGYTVLVGRNNIQNDKLSMKQANGNDMWLHTQGFPGSHVIICSKDGSVSDESIEQAAVIAAYYSKARNGSLVPVDYTPVKRLKKPQGAKPGKVIYHEYYTIITNPDEETVKKMKV